MFPTPASAKPLPTPSHDPGPSPGGPAGPRASDLLFATPGLRRDPRPRPERRAPQPANDNAPSRRPNRHGRLLNDAPLSEWNLHPIVDFGVIRQTDGQGSGAFGASRRDDNDKQRPHGGIDIAVPPGTLVRSPAEGTVRIIHEGELPGMQITTDDGRILKVIYVEPMDGIVSGSFVRAGAPIGRSMSLQKQYPSITDHVHFQLERRERDDPKSPYLVDPTELVRRWFHPPKY
jgi:murein DD-endopeptidase MepM/ murein hydrolase activator NlpD